MAETNPGQQNVAYDAATNQPRLKVDTTYDENTSLEDIQSTYTDIGDQYNRFVQDARQNVADRQTEHIGNDFGASPYNTNTYYEPAVTGFASAMRQQGTQQAFEVGMDRGRKEAEDNLKAAKNAYDNAATAYNTAYENYQKSKQQPTAATIDKSLLPEGVNEDEFANYIASSGNAAQGMQRAIDAYGLNNAGVKDWNDQAVVDRVKSELGENSEAWQAYAKHMQERNSANQYGVSERFGDSELGRIWADTYAKNYFQTYYDDSYVQAWQTEYDKVRRLVTNLMGLRNGELNWSDTIVPEQDLPNNMSVGTQFQYINIIQPEFKSTDQAASENVKVNSDGSYTINGQTYSYDEVRQKVAESQGTTPEELDKKQAGTLLNTAPTFDNQKTAFQDQVAQGKNNPLGQKWSPSSKEVWAAFAGGAAVGDLYSGYETFSISADDVAQAVLGVDIHEAKAIAKMKAENPDGYARLTDQITRAITDATVFEVADGVKEYHTKDGYKVLDKGTVVMNVPDAVLDADGNVIDKDLKRMMELYAESDDPTMNQQELMDEYGKAWRAYATRVAWARAVTNQTDEQINSDIYAALLYSQDKNEYKDVKIGDKTAEELLAEFRQKTETNPEEAYREFTGLWQKAYENVGYFFVNNGGKYEARNLYDENGESMIGRYGEENSQKDMEANRAMALVALYANSMDAFNAGQKDGNINPNFIEADGADDWNTFWTGIGRNIQADAHIVLSAAAGGIAGAATGTAAGPVVGNILGGVVGMIGGVIANGGLERDFGPGDFGYDVARNNKSSELLRQSVNPLSLSLWGLDDDKSDKFGTSYETIRAVGDFFRDALGMMTTLGLESVATAGVEAVGTAALNGIKSGVASSAGKLLRAGQDLTIKNVADAAKRGMVQDLMNPTDELGQSITTNVARDLANPTDEITQAVTEKYTSKAAETAAGYTDDLIDDVGEEAAKATSRSSTVAGDLARTQSMIDARITPVVKELNTVANNSMDDVMRSISYIANNIDDFTNFGIKFSEEATKFITKKSIAETLAKAGYTNIDDATLNAATQFMRQNIQNLGGVAARQTYQTALISGFLGANPSTVSKATSETLTYLSKAIGKWYDNPSVMSNFSGIWGAQATGQMSMEGIKKSFANILEESAKAAASGMAYGKSDIVRHLARDGWKTAQLKEVFKTTVFRDHGLADDMLYDIIHGYTVPTIDDEGNAVHMSVEDYFRTGQWMFPLAVNGMQMAGGAVFRRIQSAGLNKKLDKAYRALSATEIDSPDYGRRFAEVQKLSAKAEKIANRIMDKNIEFGKMNDVAKKGHAYVDEANEKLFQGLTKDMEAVEKNFSFKTRAEQAEFLKKRFKAPDAVAQAYVNAQTDAFITYPHLKKLLGGDNPSALANLEERGILARIWETMARVADENRMSIKENKRLKSIWDKQAEMRRLQKNAVMDALRGPDGLSAVSDLESSLDSWFNAIDDVAKKNVANGVMGEDKVRLGYLPITGMLIGEPNDGVPAAARGLWLGDESGHAMAISAADPVMQREINVTDLIKAYKNGDKVATYLDSKGNVVEVEFNPQGFQFMDAAVAYRNSNTFHRTVGSILGGDAESTGGAAVKSGFVQFFGENNSKAAANADLTEINTQIADLETKAKAAMTDDLKKKDLRARKRAEKALSNLSRQEDSILKNMGRQTMAAEDMRLAAKTLTEIATEGRRPDNAPSAKELLGITNDSDAQKVFNVARQKVAKDIKKVQGGDKLDLGEDALYREMIENAAKRNGHFDYDLVARRMLLDNDIKNDVPVGEAVDIRSEAQAEFENQPTQLNLKYNRKTKKYEASSLKELSNIDLDKASNRSRVNAELSRLIAQDSGIAGDRGLKDQYMRVVQDAFSQAQTIMNDQIKLDDIGGEGGFAHGFFTYLDIVDRLLPDKDLYNTAVTSKLVNRLNALGRDGITLRQLKDSVMAKIEVERAAGNPVDDLVTTYKVLDMADDAGTRAAGTGDYTPGRIKDVEWGSGDEEDLGPGMSEGVANIFGQRVDSTDAYSADFSAEDLMINRAQSPAQINYNDLSTKDRSLYDMIYSKMNLLEKDDLNKALETTANTLSKMTNNGSKLYDPSLKAMRDETAALFKTANDIREEINKAVKQLAKTDKETKQLIDAEAARRTARQASFGKKSQANATYDGSAALGIARPGSAVLYSENPARYNAIAASIRNGEAGLAVDVRSLRGQGIPDAQSILAYFREGRDGLDNLDSLINFDAGSPAGIYHQLRHAALYLHEKGYDTTELGKKLNAMKTELGNSLDSYGDAYGNYNPPEFSLAAALAEVADKKSFFDDTLRNGIDRIRTDETGSNTWKATNLDPKDYPIKDRSGKVLGYKELEYTSGGTSDKTHLAALEVEGTGAEQVFLNVLDENGDDIDFMSKYNVSPQSLDGMRLEDMQGPNGGNLYLYNDNGTLKLREDGVWAGDNPTNLDGSFRDTRVDEKWAEYLAATKNKKSYDEMMEEVQKLEKRAARADKKAEKLAGQRIQVEDELGNAKTKSLKSVIDEAQNVNYKKYMSPEDYELYKKLKTNKNQIDDYLNGKTEVYHSLRGATFNGDGAGYSNMVRMSDYLRTLGYTPDAKELNADAFDAKLMKKQLRKGNLSAKKNWGKPVIDATALPDKMDKKSAELTVANLLNFYKQAVKQSGLDYIDMDQMWVDKSYIELLARYADTPNAPTGLMSFASKVSALPQWIQQQQLAGGWGPMNALTLAQVRSAILEDPRKAITFARMLADMRNSKTAVASVLDRSDLYARIAMHTGDGSIVTDLYPAISKRSGRDDGGVIQTFATKILDRTDKERAVNRFPKGFRENIKADLEDFFENPTFMQAMPVLRAQMMSMNYDAALTKLQKKFGSRIGKDISTIEIEEAAMDVAYARTQKFFTPQKYWSGNMEAGLQKIKNENIRKLVGQITGEGTPTTVMDIASSAFFALRYKQTFVNRFVQGVKDFSGVPGMLRHQLSQSATVGQVAQDLSNVGQMKGIASLIGIAVLAKVWCDAMGVPNAWDDFDFNPEGDEVFHMPSVLMKFQNAGQIWLPNDTREDGTPYVNPNKTAYKLDPMFSMFTLPNSAMRAVNMAFNGQTDSYKAPQRGLPFLPQNGVINSMVNSNIGRAIGDELIGSNLLSPFKAMHEIITNSTYFGNNIWERKYLPDGRENPNYDPGRNAASSVMHLLGLDNVLDPNGYNRWVKGGDDMVRQDQVGTISGSGILQHEYASAAIALMSGDLFGAFTEAGELPIKTQRLSSNARTEMNTVVKNTLDHYGDDYRAKMKSATSVDQKDEIYAEYAKKCADEVARWSAKFGYLLGENQELVASSTRLLMAMTSGEYDDTMAYVQNAYWKASQIAQIESGTALFLKDSDLDDWLKNGGTVESFTEEKNRRSQAYNQALDEEWEARKALIDAGYNPEYLAGSSYEDLRAEQRSVSKKIYTSIMSKFEKQVGEFKNYKELQAYYEEMIANAGTKKQKVKLANQYNQYITDIISEAIAEYGPAVLTEATYNGKGITQQISDYIIVPADKYYTGKSPKSNYLRDLFGVGYRNGKNLPSDDELREKWDTVKWLVSHGKPASASTILDTMVKNIKNGRWYASDVDYSDIIRLKSKLRSKQ